MGTLVTSNIKSYLPLTVNNDRFFARHPVVVLIDQCSNLRHLKEIHAQMLKNGLFFDPFASSKLIQAASLSEFPSILYAQKVFDQMPQPNIYSFNALIRAYSSSEPIMALYVFVKMLYESSEMPSKFTYPFVVKAAAELCWFRIGKALHGLVIKSNLGSDLFINNSLIHCYAECGSSDMAYGLFLSMKDRDVVSWNSIIKGFSMDGCADKALDLFHRMEEENLRPNDVTMIGVLTACGKKRDLELGRWIHEYIEKNGIKQILPLNNAILDMYMKCGGSVDAKRLFDKMKEKDIVSWTTMLAGYARLGDFVAARNLFDAMPCQDTAAWNALISAYEQCGNPKEALAVFHELLQNKKSKPDQWTLVSALSACAHLGAMDLGRWIHVYIKKNRVQLNCHLTTSLIDMYAKCGDIEKALEVFHSVDKRDVYVWSAMIAGLAMYGRGRDAIALFFKMNGAKVRPNAVTFTNLLSACSHSGLVEEGRSFFKQMESIYGVVQESKHYSCMVDVLGRAGHLEEALGLIENMPVSAEASVWGALLGASILHGNIHMAEQAGTRLLELEPQNDGAYVLLSNIYAKLGNWDKVSLLRKAMKDSGIKKEPGCSSIEVNGAVHEFLAGDNTHPRAHEIYSKLEEVVNKLKSCGYRPKTSELLQLVEEEDVQEQALNSHSEKLAIAFGLISTDSSQPMRIMKNLRVCGDCHSVAKLISRLYGREILLRDRYRFHHFKDGNCSCMDYY
ncbi:hypothetical protein Leryth_016484 [Lithospermum erythrorhizon]|nr:hypothetical protein Leryth_016484 [Lithospermum erythrorhizon]